MNKPEQHESTSVFNTVGFYIWFNPCSREPFQENLNHAGMLMVTIIKLNQTYSQVYSETNVKTADTPSYALQTPEGPGPHTRRTS